MTIMGYRFVIDLELKQLLARTDCHLPCVLSELVRVKRRKHCLLRTSIFLVRVSQNSMRSSYAANLCDFSYRKGLRISLSIIEEFLVPHSSISV